MLEPLPGQSQPASTIRRMMIVIQGFLTLEILHPQISARRERDRRRRMGMMVERE